MKRPSTKTLIVSGWAICLVLTAFVSSWLQDIFFLLDRLLWLAIGVSGLWLIVRSLKNRSWAAAAAIWALGVVTVMLPVDTLGQAANLAFRQEHYEDVIRQSGSLSNEGVASDVKYQISRRAPLLIYFETSTGLLSHGGFLYDAADSTESEVIGSTIGGALTDYQTCNRVRARWYRCWFD